MTVNPDAPLRLGGGPAEGFPSETTDRTTGERIGPGAPHRIIVVVGGAGGLELATRLGDKLGRGNRAHVTLIEKARTHFWKPHLHEIADRKHRAIEPASGRYVKAKAE